MIINVSNYLFRSEDQGEHFSSVKYPYSDTLKFFNERESHDPPVLSHPDSANIVYAAAHAVGSGLVCKSIDGGETFSKDSAEYSSVNPIDSTWAWEWGVVSAMNISKSNPAVFYYSIYKPPYWGGNSFNTFIKKTDDYGGSWDIFNFKTECMQQNETMSVKITEIEIDKTNPDNVFVTVGNFYDGKKIFQTTDGWDTWTNISHDLPNIPVNTIVYDEQTDCLYIGTDVGLFYLTNVSNGSDNTWERYGDFPLAICSDIKINHQTNEIIAATYGRGVWRADLSCFYDETPKSITTNTTWDGTRTITNNWNIESGVTLTISSNSYVKFVGETSLTVKAGGKLIIDGARLTNTCDELWSGITVFGNSDSAQWNNISSQGYLEVKNGAIIENAKNAIFVGDKDIPWGPQNGGIVKIDNAIFRNNISCIEIPIYQNYFFNDPENAMRNFSYIRNSTFETTDYLARIGKKANSFISLWAVNGISIRNNTFKNSNPEAYAISDRGTGIRTWDANYSSIYNIFEDLRYGIYSEGTGELLYFNIDDCNFIRNYKSIYLNAVNNAMIRRNNLNLNGFNGIYSYGISIYNSNDFIIDENIINGRTAQNYHDRGINLSGIAESNNSIYKNTFSNLRYSLVSKNALNIIFECNEFSGNSNYGIYIINDGSFWSQGTDTHPIGNKFLEPNNYFDIYSNNQIIAYYYDEQNSYIPERTNDKILMFALENVENTCPSHFGGNNNNNGGGDITIIDDKIIEKEDELREKVDGGSTDNTISDIQNSNSDLALELRNSLLEKSPNLSDTVMITTVVNEDILPKIMLTEVLSANSQSAKSEKISDALDNREDPLQNYLRAEINLGRDSISSKEKLEIEIFKLKNEKYRMYKNKVISFLNDTTQSSKDSLLYLLENENNLSGKYRLLSYYISKKDHINAENLLNSIDTDFELNQSQRSEYNKILVFYFIQKDLLENNKTYFELDSLQKQNLLSLSEDTVSQSGAYARSIISLIDNVEYDFNFPHIPEEQQDFSYRNLLELELVFKLTPNPAKDYFIAEYEIPSYNFTNAFFKMYNSHNKKVHEEQLKKRAFQLLIETEKFASGVYICKLFVDGKESANDLITIKQDKMIAEQMEQSDKFKDSQFKEELHIFPNPASNFIFVKYNIENEIFENGKIILCDNSGKTVKTKKLKTKKGEIPISISDLSEGIYNVIISVDDKIIKIKKFVK